MSHSTNRVVFPKPAGAETSVSLRSSARARASCRRGRSTRFGRVLGARSLVVTSVWGTAAPTRFSLNISLLRGSCTAKPLFSLRLSTPHSTFWSMHNIPSGGMLFASSQPRFGAKIMTDKDGFVDRVRDHATDDDSPRAHQAPERRR